MTKADPEQTSATEPVNVPVDPAAEEFYSNAEKRMSRSAAVLGTLGLAGVAAIAGKAAAIGFAMGGVLGIFNFAWLHRSARSTANSLAESASGGVKAPLAGAAIGLGFVLRLSLVTAVGYAIFKGSIQSFYGYLGGLAVPLAAMLGEALYEAWVALRRGL